MTLLLTIIFFYLSGCSHSSGTVIPEEWSGQGNIHIYKVYGMDCPGCHGGVEKQLVDLDGVQAAHADWSRKQVAILLLTDREVAEDEIRAAIERANFTPGERIQ